MNFSDHGIIVNTKGSDQQLVKCPLCSGLRKKSHLKTLSVNIRLGIWNCHHCEFSGSLYIFKPLYQKVKKVVEYKKPDPVLEQDMDYPDDFVNYFKDRGISKETLLACKITRQQSYMPQVAEIATCMVFNYFINGQIINKKYRDIKKNFKLEKDARLVMYAPFGIANKRLIKDPPSIIITEGEIDCLSIIECGNKFCLSVPNGAPDYKSNIESADFSYLESLNDLFYDFSKINKIVLVMDSDKVGIKFRNEIARRLGFERCYTVEYPKDCKDINDVLVKYGKDKVKECINNSKPYPVDGVHKVDGLYPKIIYLYENGYESGVSTGWVGVDSIYRPRTKEFTVITGIPNHGKSTWLNCLTVNISRKHKWKIAVYSPENFPFERHISELMSSHCGKPFDTGYKERMSEHDVEVSAKWINEYFSFIMPKNDDHSIDDILELVRISIFRDGVKGVIIDPWNEIEHNRGQMSETDYVSKSLSKVRRFCRINDVHIWIVAHPTKLQKDRDGNYPIPTPYDISGSAHWRNKPDVCICVYRDFETNITSIYNQKTRFREVGKIGEAKLRFNPNSNRYYD